MKLCDSRWYVGPEMFCEFAQSIIVPYVSDGSRSHDDHLIDGSRLKEKLSRVNDDLRFTRPTFRRNEVKRMVDDGLHVLTLMWERREAAAAKIEHASAQIFDGRIVGSANGRPVEGNKNRARAPYVGHDRFARCAPDVSWLHCTPKRAHTLGMHRVLMVDHVFEGTKARPTCCHKRITRALTHGCRPTGERRRSHERAVSMIACLKYCVMLAVQFAAVASDVRMLQPRPIG